MEPQIQYATTSDGAKIAFWALGEGPVLIMLPPLPASHLELEWGIREWRAFYERLARHVTIVRYDARGMGLSSRDEELSLEAFERDLDAVIHALGASRVTLFGLLHSGPVACMYAAHHPDVVERLVLWGTYARNEDLELDREHWELRLLAQNWETYTETITHQVLGWSSGPIARQTAALLRDSLTPEAMSRFIEFAFGIDVTALLPQIKAPTLIMHRRDQQKIFAGDARDLASGIAGSRLVLMDGESMAPFMGDTQPFFTTLASFMDIPGLAERGDAPPAVAPAAIRTIVFTDIAGSTALTQRLGDDRARDLLRAHEEIVRDALARHGGAEVKTLGDGFMASFASATQGLQFAIAIQQATAAFNADAPEPLAVRVGVNAGEPIAERDDLFGTAVIAAARIADAAAGGEIIVSDVVRQLTAGKGFLFADRGERLLHGFEDPVRLYEVRWRDAPA